MSYIIGLTGGIGSGKSAASAWFAEQGICVVDTDVVARQVVEPNQLTLKQIQHQFGDWVLTQNGELNRAALREYIFNHPEARLQLNVIMHPAIRAMMLSQLQAASSPYAILVSPLLFETAQHQLTDRTLLIDSPVELQLTRASQRDDQNTQQIEKIIQTQMPRQQKQILADDIVLNETNLDDLYTQLALLHQNYLQLAKNKKQP